MNNNEREEDINDAINNYITYSREYLLLAHNMLAFSSRNDERLYNLMSLHVRNNQQDRYNTPIVNQTSIPAPSMTNNMHRNNNSNRNRRSTNTNTRNVRHRPTYNRTTNVQNGLYSGLHRPNDMFNTLFTGSTEAPSNVNNDELSTDRGLSELFLQAINGLTNLESVPIFPTNQEINTACEDVSFNTISNPINSSCPINLERFTNNSTVTQILYCGHCYEPSALRTWFRSNVRCPICRYDIRNYNPMDIIRNPYRRILRNPNLRPVERPNNQSSVTEPIIVPSLQPTPNSEPTNTPNSEPTSDINIESTILNDTDLSLSSLPENYNILHQNDNEEIINEEHTVNDFNNNNDLANVMRNNLNSMIINDLSNNLNNNSNLIFSDLSNNGQGPIIDLSYQIFFH